MATSGYVEALLETMRTAGLEFTVAQSNSRGWRSHVVSNAELELAFIINERTNGRRIDVVSTQYYPEYNLATMLQQVLKLFGDAVEKKTKEKNAEYYDSEMRDSPCGPARWKSFSGQYSESVMAPGVFVTAHSDGIQVVFKTRDGETYRHLLNILGEILYFERNRDDASGTAD